MHSILGSQRLYSALSIMFVVVCSVAILVHVTLTSLPCCFCISFFSARESPFTAPSIFCSFRSSSYLHLRLAFASLISLSNSTSLRLSHSFHLCSRSISCLARTPVTGLKSPISHSILGCYASRYGIYNQHMSCLALPCSCDFSHCSCVSVCRLTTTSPTLRPRVRCSLFPTHPLHLVWAQASLYFELGRARETRIRITISTRRPCLS